MTAPVRVIQNSPSKKSRSRPVDSRARFQGQPRLLSTNALASGDPLSNERVVVSSDVCLAKRYLRATPGNDRQAIDTFEIVVAADQCRTKSTSPRMIVQVTTRSPWFSPAIQFSIRGAALIKSLIAFVSSK